MALSSLLVLAADGGAGQAPELERAQAEIQLLEASPAGEAASQQAALQAWREAAELLKEAGRWSDEAGRFDQLRSDAPATLERLRRELAAAPQPLPARDDSRELAALEQDLAQALAQQATAEQLVRDLQGERRTRTDRRLSLPGEINRLQQHLDAVVSPAASPAGSDEPPALLEARQARAAAQARSLQAELQARQAELQSYEARSELLTVRQDLAVRRAGEAAAMAQELSQRVNEKRSLQADSAAAEAEAARRRLAAEPAPIRELAEDNEARAGERRSLVAQTVEASALAAVLRAEADRIAQRSESVSRKVQAARFTTPVALLMRRHLAELPEAGRHRARLRVRQKEVASQLVGQLDIEDERAELTDLDAATSEVLVRLGPAGSDEVRAAQQATVRELLGQRRQLLDDLYQEQGAYLTQLAELDAAERRLVDLVEAYGDFIEEHLLWLRGAAVWGPGALGNAAGALGWLLAPSAWRELGAALSRDLLARPLQLAAGLVLVLLVVLRRQLRSRVRAIGAELGRSRRHRFWQTGQALVLTLVGVAVWPTACWWLSSTLAVAATETRLGPPLAAGLGALARLLLAWFLVRDVFRPQGLAHAHYRWPSQVLERVREQGWLLAGVAVPAFAVTAVFDAQERVDFRDSLGRLALIVGLLALARFLRKTLAPGLRPPSARRRVGVFLHRAGWLLPVVLALAAFVGFNFAAREIGLRFLETCLLLFVVSIAHATALRWVVVERRRLRLEELRRSDQAGTAPELAGEGAVEPMIQADSPDLDLDVVDSQARQLLRAAAVVAVAASAWWLWADFLPATRWTERVVVWQVGSGGEAATAAAGAEGAPRASTPESAGEAGVPRALAADGGPAPGAVTLFDLLVAVALVGLTIFAAGNVPGLLEIALLRRLELAPGTGYAVTTLTRYAITIVGLVAAAALIGITWRSVQWLAAAVTVGLGFGLQEIFANFVSGLIILFERPIRVGDIVTVGGVEGQVTRIRTRATTISDWDRRELLVPNREFITGQLINWTLTDPVTRVVIPVGIAYGSDTRLATEKLMECAKGNPIVLEEPRPSVVFRSFGESSLNFELRVFLPRREVWPQVVHGLHTAIDDAFREAGIEIAFPQRDVHVRTLPERLAGGSAESG